MTKTAVQPVRTPPRAGPVTIRIGGRSVGAGRRVYVIAEAGVNHNGSVETAGELIRRAAEAGADAVKFQAFVPELLCSRIHRADEIAMLRPLALAEADLASLGRTAGDNGLDFLCTPFDPASVETVRRLGCPVMKIGSGELTHTPMLEQVAGVGVPVILSTGGGDESDVTRAVAALWSGGSREIALLHCTSAYPAPAEGLNLAAIERMRRRFSDCVIGYSDHSQGSTAAVMAVALGAAILEKHLTLDRTMAGPDHAASCEPDDFAALVRQIRLAESMRGDGRKRPAHCEPTLGRSIVAARDLPRGSILGPGDLTFKRPGTGLRPHRLAHVLGRRLVRDVPADELILESDLKEESADCADARTQIAQISGIEKRSPF